MKVVEEELLDNRMEESGIFLICTLQFCQLTTSYHFVPIAFETLGPINSSGVELIKELGRRECSENIHQHCMYLALTACVLYCIYF